MIMKQDVKESLKNVSLMKINGQPQDESLNQLKNELSTLADGIPKQMEEDLIDMLEYFLIQLSTSYSQQINPFIILMNPGAYPTVISHDAIKRRCQLMEHKVKILELETYLGACHALRLFIECIFDPEWLEAIWSPSLGFTHNAP